MERPDTPAAVASPRARDRWHTATPARSPLHSQEEEAGFTPIQMRGGGVFWADPTASLHLDILCTRASEARSCYGLQGPRLCHQPSPAGSLGCLSPRYGLAGVLDTHGEESSCGLSDSWQALFTPPPISITLIGGCGLVELRVYKSTSCLVRQY